MCSTSGATASSKPQSDISRREDTGTLSNEDPVMVDDSPPAPLYPPDRVFSKEQLDVMNLLIHPVWVFDVDHQRINWANGPAADFWKASSIEDLLSKNFDDMTEASITRMHTYQAKLRQGQRITDQWTVYPNNEATTINIFISGIRLSADEPNPSLLVEALPVQGDKLQPETLRGVEMLRHLPVPVCQFDMDGKIMFQNPEGVLAQKPSEECKEDSNSNSNLSAMNNFLSRFVDPELGEEALQKMQAGQTKEVDNGKTEATLNLQANIRTRNGPRWSAVQLRKTSDPVTGKPVILYSSRDMSDAIQAQKERKASIKKSEFLAIMAHEIRTPLHQVTGFIDLLDQTELDKEQRSFVKLLKSSAQGLMTVINDVLDFSKLEAGKMKLETMPYEPRSVLEGSMAAVRGSCEEKNIYLKMDWDKCIPFKVMGDPNRVRQILLNLLSNAVKFTKDGGIEVKVSTWKSNPITASADGTCRSMIRCVVTDTGQGISDEHKRLVFQQYQQGSASTARNFGGTGLGLSICKLLVQNMGGSIGVHSQFGKGSSFWFMLPAEEPAEVDTKQDELEASFRDEVSLHVLVAEDNRVNQKLVANMLKRMGHTSDIAFNGKKAIGMLEENPHLYDVILMDIQMPVMDGLEATRRIRSLGYGDLPIFGLTASVARSDYGELGFDDWLAKPIPMNVLRTKLYRLGSKKQRRQDRNFEIVLEKSKSLG